MSSLAGTDVPVTFDKAYEEQFSFVWQSLRRLGVAESALDDAAQDAWVVVHRQIGAFEGRSGLRAWLFAIVRRVAHDHRRRRDRKDGGQAGHAELGDGHVDPRPDPSEAAENAAAWREVAACLEALDEDKRAVFVLAELEGMSAPEIAECVGCPVNTVYSRLRAARRLFEEALERRRR